MTLNAPRIHHVTENPATHRYRVLAHFEKCRAAPGAPFDEERFLDHLVANPSAARAAYNSFGGLRRLNRFLEAIQLEFSVCFSMKDRDSNPSLEAFVARIQELQQSRQSSLASLRNRKQHRFGWLAVIFANLLAFPLWMAAFRWDARAGWVVFGACVAVTALALRLYIMDKLYLKRLGRQIEALESR